MEREDEFRATFDEGLSNAGRMESAEFKWVFHFFSFSDVGSEGVIL